jgi:hypothetical protein|tara:strand:- start:1438 stop:2022 length:585 start_codon:yes stop_codon:yes gene_type:complete
MGRHPVMVRQVCPLVPFDIDQSPAIHAVAEFVWRENAALELSFSLCPKLAEDGFDLLNLPSSSSSKASGSSQRLDNLWLHTCFEAFLARPGEAEYWELNASPKGDWNLYRFNAYRTGGLAEPKALAPGVTFSRDRFGCRCTIEIELHPWWRHAEIPEFGLTMVVEDGSNNLSYWALSHPGNQPDFHDRRGFLRS